MTPFSEVFKRATGNEPYPYQQRLADEGLPELIEVPTGLGKTAGTVLAWLYRRRLHDDPAVRGATPQRLVFVLPMRVLVEQTVAAVDVWLDRLGLGDAVKVRVLMGGEPMRGPHDWRNDVDRDAIVIGTLDMVLSRCLNRGYGESRYLWPIDFGLLNSGSHFVFDEVQLMGPALGTSRQLHGLRLRLGALRGCSSTWMSATVDRDALATVDAPAIASEAALGDADLSAPRVLRRFRAQKHLRELVVVDQKKREAEIAAAVVREHRPGTLSLVIVNRVNAATEIHRHLRRAAPAAEVVLLHSRFRPGDRAKRVAEATAAVPPEGPGRIVVSTQVVEAGVDVSATTMFTDVAPWPSLVQRAGRCNRTGEEVEPAMWWMRVPSEAAAPYEPADLNAATAALEALEDSDVDSATLGAQAVAVVQPIVAVLRKRDLVELFDTLPDLTGNDIDISRFLRDADELDVAVAWRTNPGGDDLMPARPERCPVPVGEFRKWLKRDRNGVVRWNALERTWVPAIEADVRPGMVFVIDAQRGGYSDELGWSPDTKAAVEPVLTDERAADDQSTGDDPASLGNHWVALSDHLRDTERQADQLLTSNGGASMPAALADAVRRACRLHDIGKAHYLFQNVMRAKVSQAGVDIPAAVILAKSATTDVLRYERAGFRHELASALALLGEGRVALHGVAEPDLVVYLVAAHHGRIRLGARSLPHDRDNDAPAVLGVCTGDTLPAVDVGDTELPASTLDVGALSLGGDGSGLSWTERALALRDRDDLGPFRLGYLEALVRLADWRASSEPTALRLEHTDA